MKPHLEEERASVSQDAAVAAILNGYDTSLAGSRATSGSGPLVVIDPRPLTRQSLVEMLARGLPDHTIVAVSGCDELLNSCAKTGPGPGVIILNTGPGGVHGAWAQDTLQWLTLRLASVPLIVLSANDDAEEASELLASGVRGYLPTSANPEIAFAAVRLVYAGGTYIPEHLFRKIVHREAPRPSPHTIRRVDLPTVADLTPREGMVAALLRDGKPNKVIAAELKMQESTVKVHVRNIMRKLRARNRTQAALAASNMFGRRADR
ncbi:MAG: response regulator transcription factor [Acetobacteraceae bacterium]|nr:response regulator transcription factor [Acetobacteraceae bacterium]